MKKWMKATGAALMVTVLITTAVMASDITFGSGGALEDESLTLEEMLRYALEDERMAQAEYEAIMEAFDVTRPFSNIAQAEVTHEEAVIGLYETRGLSVPDFDPTGLVVIPDTLDETFAIGVEAEINNIAMYDLFLEQDLDEDVRLVFQALRDASVNHLAAFERGLSGTGSSGGSRAGGNFAGGRGNGRH